MELLFFYCGTTLYCTSMVDISIIFVCVWLRQRVVASNMNIDNGYINFFFFFSPFFLFSFFLFFFFFSPFFFWITFHYTYSSTLIDGPIRVKENMVAKKHLQRYPFIIADVLGGHIIISFTAVSKCGKKEKK